MSIRKLIGETAIYGMSSILSRVLNYVILTPYLTRVFTTGEYGIVSELFFYAGFLTVLFTYRMETAFFRFGSKADNIEKAYSTATLSLVASTIFFALALLGFSTPIAALLDYPNNVEYVQIVVLLIAFDALMAIPFARLRLENRPIKFAVLKMLHILITILLIFFFLKFCPLLIEQGYTFFENFYDPDNQIQYVFIANLVASGISLLILLPEYAKIRLAFDFTYWKEMFWYALPLVVVGFAAIINQLGAIPLLSKILPDAVEQNRAQTGTYGATIKLAVLMNLFTQAFNYAAEPFFFRHSKEKGSKKMYGQVGLMFTLVGSIVFLGIMFYIDLIQFFLGADFRSGLEVVPILLIANLLLGIYYNFSIWYKLADKTIWGAYISIGGALITILVNLALIPIYGYLGSAWATLSCYAFMVLACYWSGKGFYPIPYPIGRMLLYVAVAIALYLVSSFLKGWIAGSLVVTLGANTILLIGYLGFIYLLEGTRIKKMLAK